MPELAQILTIDNMLALVTLTALEIVLGVDNIVLIAILTGRLPKERQAAARRIGLGLAMFFRVALLLSLTWLMKLTAPLFGLWGNEFSGRDIILFAGGAFLLAKGTSEIHKSLEGGEEEHAAGKVASFSGVITQILLLDIVFSLDSVITAVGMAEEIWVMVTAVIIAVGLMMFFAGTVSRFIEKRPTVKMLALAFVLLIGVTLVIESFGKHMDKAYIYFAMGFSLGVEMLNLRLRKKREPVRLHTPRMEDAEAAPAGGQG